MKSKFKKALVTVLAIAGLLGAGLVYAAWTESGSGSVYSKAGSAQALTTVDVSASTAATLYPGGNGDAIVKFSNPNPYPIKITSVSLDTSGSIAADGSHSGCAGSNASFTNQSGLSVVVPAQTSGTNGTTQTTLTGSVAMSSTAPDACQGAVFTIPVTFAGVSN
jgi:hypothetical protein